MTKKTATKAVGLWFELDKETNRLLKNTAEVSELKPLKSSKTMFTKRILTEFSVLF